MNVISAVGPVTPNAADPTVTITDDSIANLRAGMKTMFNWQEGTDVVATLTIHPDNTAEVDVSQAYSIVSAPKPITSLISNTSAFIAPAIKPIDLTAAIGSSLKDFRAFIPTTGDLNIPIRFPADGIFVGAVHIPSDSDATVASGPVQYGIFFPVVIDFPQPFARDDKYCDCTGANNYGTFPQCQKICFEMNTALPGHCETIYLATWLNPLHLYIGLIPKAPPTASWQWTQNLFSGAKNFHLNDMFDVKVVRAGLMTRDGKHYTDLQLNGCTSDVCVGVTVSDCDIDASAACDATDCQTTVADEVADRVTGTLHKAFGEALVNNSQLNYAGEKFYPTPPPDAPCYVTGDSANPCDKLALNYYLPASATYQKWDWFLSPFVGLPPFGLGYLPVTNITAATTGEHRTVAGRSVPLANITIHYDIDPDGDGVPTGQDNCPNYKNPLQTDSDLDGVGDGCDPCPFSAGPPPFFGDKDGDGICDDVDNCPDDKNAAQDNCNEEAELASGAALRGDACDPVPCAVSSAGRQLLIASFAPDCTGTPSLPGSNCNVTVDTHIQWRGVVKDATSSPGEVELAHCVCNDWPHKFIQDRLAHCQMMFLGPNLSVPRCVSGKHAAFPEKNGAQSPSAWKASTTTFSIPNTVSPSGSLFERNHRYATDYALLTSPVKQTRWRFDQDLAEFGVAPPATPVVSANDLLPTAGALDGVGWAYTPSYKGNVLFNGAADLASHYFEQDLSPQAAKADISIAGLLNTCQAGGPCDFLLDTRLLLVDPDPNKVQLVSPGGFVEPARVSVSALAASVLSNLNNGTTYVPASEPARALNELGVGVRGAVILDAGGALLGTVVNSPAGIEFAPSTRALDPPPTTVRAVSGTNAELYEVVSDPSTQTATLARTPLPSGPGDTATTNIAGVGQLGTLLSMTYRKADDSLYLLDRIDEKPFKHFVRLIQVSRSGIGVERGRVRTFGLYERFFLTATADDLLVITASGKLPALHPLYAMVDPSPAEPRLVAWLLDPDKGQVLLAPDTADGSVYLIVRRAGTAPIQFTTVDRTSFRSPPPGRNMTDGLDGKI